MKLKKLLASVLATAMVASLSVIPVHASGFSSANILDGGSKMRGEFKGSNGNNASYYNRTHTGSGDAREVMLTMNTNWKAQRALFESGIANPLSGTDYSKVHFAHARIMMAVKKVGTEKVVLRLNPVASDWTKDGKTVNTAFNIVYPTDGVAYMGAYGTGVKHNSQCCYYSSTDPTDMSSNGLNARGNLIYGTTDTPQYQTFDFIFDCTKGYIYGYVDGKLVATMVSAISKFGNFYGYCVTGTGDEKVFAAGTKVWAKYDSARPGETIYVDTPDYTVRLEDVIADAGLASNNGDPYEIMESDHIADYIFAGSTASAETKTYERRDSSGNVVSMTAEKSLADFGNVSQLFGGAYYKDNDYPGYTVGKGLIHVSFDQKINATLNNGTAAASDNFSYRLRTQATNVELFYMQPNNGKMEITLIEQQGDKNTTVTLDKNFNDTIHYDIVFKGRHTDSSDPYMDAVGYYFVDGQYIGSYKINRGAKAADQGTMEWWTPTQCFLYSNNTANVTYSNYKIGVYEYDKSIDEIKAEILGKYPIYWASASEDNFIEAAGNQFAVGVTPKTIWNHTSDVEGAQLIITAYNEENELLGVYTDTYESGMTTGDEAKFGVVDEKLYGDKVVNARAFVWQLNDLIPLAPVNEFNINF